MHNIRTSFSMNSLNGQRFTDGVLVDSIPEPGESNVAKGANGL